MAKTVTYTGTAGRYYVRDKNGTKHYFPSNVPVQVPDEVAALLPKKSDKFAVLDNTKAKTEAETREENT